MEIYHRAVTSLLSQLEYEIKTISYIGMVGVAEKNLTMFFLAAANLNGKATSQRQGGRFA